jgi:hypothetical protein
MTTKPQHTPTRWKELSHDDKPAAQDLERLPRGILKLFRCVHHAFEEPLAWYIETPPWKKPLRKVNLRPSPKL